MSMLIGDEQGIVFTQLCNVLDPSAAVALSSVSNELWAATKGLLAQLRDDHEEATALCRKVGLRSCKALREAKDVDWLNRGLTAADLTLLGTLGSVLPALERLTLQSLLHAGPEGVQRLAERLGAGALPAVTWLRLSMHVGDAGASALAAALGRGAMPQLKRLVLTNVGITDAGLVALAPALRRLPALEHLKLNYNPLGDEGLAALVAPPTRAGAPPPTGVLTKLKKLNLYDTQIADAGCAALAAALDNGTLPALVVANLEGPPASGAARASVAGALTMWRNLWSLRQEMEEKAASRQRAAEQLGSVIRRQVEQGPSR